MSSRQPWLSSEPGALDALVQLISLLRAGARRYVLTLSLTALVAAALSAFFVLRHRDHAPRFVLRVVEADRQAISSPALKRQLAAYVRQAVFTSEPLLEVMSRHDLYPSLRRKNTRAALESFKEDISVDVYQNYFVEERRPGSAPRSARLTVSFPSKDPVQALAVTRELGALVARREQERRRQLAREDAERAERAREILVRAVQERSALILQKQREIELAPSPDPRTQVELVGLMGSLEALERQAEAAEKRAASVGLGAALEQSGMGLHFEVVDEGTLPARAARIKAEILAVALATLLALPLIALAVGAVSLKRGIA